MKMQSIGFVAALLGSELAPVHAAPLNANAFAYDSQAPLEIKMANAVERDGAVVRDISFASTTHRVTGVES